jgi:hypothetical protein
MKAIDKKEQFRFDDVGQLFSILNILNILRDTKSFREWMVSTGKFRDDIGTFEGYRFSIEIVLNCLIYSIIYEDSFQLKEDIVFSRARFDGIPIEDIPDSCEKMIFVRKIWALTRKIRKSRDWDELDTNIGSLIVAIAPFNMVWENNVFCTGNRNKQRYLNLSTRFYVDVFLHDCERGIPKGCWISPITNCYKKPEYLKRTYWGYVYSLQFIWSRLLGNDYEKSSFSTIDNVVIKYQKDARNLMRSEGWYSPKGSASKENIDTLKTRRKTREIAVKWIALDILLREISHEMVKPMITSVDVLKNPKFRLKKYDKTVFSGLLFTESPHRPIYLTKTDKKSIGQKLDYHFLWYPLDVLDPRNTVYNGVTSFISLVLGSIDLHKRHGSFDPLMIRIFKHPAKGIDGGNDYSFSILIEAFGSISDYSGWLVFFNCAGDYSGFAGYQYAMTMRYLNDLRETRGIELEEITIGINQFREYLEEHGKSMMEDSNGLGILKSTEVIQRLSSILGAIRGKFFEYVFFSRIVSNGDYIEHHVNWTLNGEEIDCIGIGEESADIFECKIDVHEDWRKIKEEIDKKMTAVGKDYPGKILTPHLIVYNGISQERRDEIIRAGIKLRDNFREDIRKERGDKAGRNTILSILDYQLGRQRE